MALKDDADLTHCVALAQQMGWTTVALTATQKQKPVVSQVGVVACWGGWDLGDWLLWLVQGPVVSKHEVDQLRQKISDITKSAATPGPKVTLKVSSAAVMHPPPTDSREVAGGEGYGVVSQLSAVMRGEASDGVMAAVGVTLGVTVAMAVCALVMRLGRQK